jgi:hypothetical protein
VQPNVGSQSADTGIKSKPNAYGTFSLLPSWRRWWDVSDAMPGILAEYAAVLDADDALNPPSLIGRRPGSLDRRKTRL